MSTLVLDGQSELKERDLIGELPHPLPERKSDLLT